MIRSSHVTNVLNYIGWYKCPFRTGSVWLTTGPELPMSHAYPHTILTMKADSSKAIHIAAFLPPPQKKKQKKTKKSQKKHGRSFRDVVLCRAIGKTWGKHNFPWWRWPPVRWHFSPWMGNEQLPHNGAHAADGEISWYQVEYYLAYTTQIYDYASNYEWDAILDFDYIHPLHQASHGFNWGQIPTKMELSR